MSNPNNGNSGSDRTKSDRGSSITGQPMGDTSIGQRPIPPVNVLPPLKKPKK